MSGLFHELPIELLQFGILDGIYQTIRGVPRSTTANAHASNATHPSMNQIARDLRAQQVSNGTF